MIDIFDIEAARERISPYVRRTPVMDAALAREPLPVSASVTMKLELNQVTGSFKARGAMNRLLGASKDEIRNGIVTASGGNHGAAVAYAAENRGVPATIFVPSISSQAKIDRIRSYGADIVIGGDRYADALAASEVRAAETGALKVHAFDQVETLRGQGTVGLEIEADAPVATTVLVAVGGGGLIGGLAAWFAGARKVVAVEPADAPTLHAAFAAGRPVDAPTGGIAADSLAPRRIGELAFGIASAYVDPQVVLVSDDDIRCAQAGALQRLMNTLASEPPVNIEIKLHRARHILHAQVFPLGLADGNLVALQIENYGANAACPCI